MHCFSGEFKINNEIDLKAAQSCCSHAPVNLTNVHDKILPAASKLLISLIFGVPVKLSIWERHVHISPLHFLPLWFQERPTSEPVFLNRMKSKQDFYFYANNIITEHLLCSGPVLGEGNGTPLQYSCLANPMDGGAW